MCFTLFDFTQVQINNCDTLRFTGVLYDILGVYSVDIEKLRWRMRVNSLKPVIKVW